MIVGLTLFGALSLILWWYFIVANARMPWQEVSPVDHDKLSDCEAF